MPVNRYYHPEKLEIGSSFLLDEVEGRHLAQVVRGRIEERVEVVNGKGVLAKTVIKNIDKRKGVTLEVLDLICFPPKKIQTILYQAITRASRLDTIVEKVTELGVDKINLFLGERSEGILSLKRLQKIILSALKQSGRLYLPQIQEIDPIKGWKNFDSKLFYGHFGEASIPFPVGIGTVESVGIVIGPEGGLTENEERSLNRLGAVGISMSDHVLRTDTAAITAVGLLNVPIPMSGQPLPSSV